MRRAGFRTVCPKCGDRTLKAPDYEETTRVGQIRLPRCSVCDDNEPGGSVRNINWTSRIEPGLCRNCGRGIKDGEVVCSDTCRKRFSVWKCNTAKKGYTFPSDARRNPYGASPASKPKRKKRPSLTSLPPKVKPAPPPAPEPTPEPPNLKACDGCLGDFNSEELFILRGALLCQACHDITARAGARTEPDPPAPAPEPDPVPPLAEDPPEPVLEEEPCTAVALVPQDPAGQACESVRTFLEAARMVTGCRGVRVQLVLGVDGETEVSTPEFLFGGPE